MGWLPLGDELSLAPRIGVGTAGRKIKLQANYFTVQIKNLDIELTHYDVSIAEPGKREVIPEPGKKKHTLPKSRRLQIFEAMKEQYSEVFEDHALAYDSEKNAYCVSGIPRIEKGFQCQVNVPDRDGRHRSTFNVTLTMVNHACLRDLLKSIKYVPGKPQIFTQTIFQMLEVMFQHSPRIQYNCIGKNTFYSLDGKFGAPVSLGGGKECVLGFFSSLKPCSWKDGSLLLNIDISHTAYYKEQDVLDYMRTLGYRDQDFNGTLDDKKRLKLIKQLKDFKIRVTHARYPRTYRIKTVTAKGADCQTFPFEDPNTKKVSDCTVEKFFRKQYNKKLRYPKLNCLNMGPENKNTYIPIEFCRISKGQKVNKKLNDSETGAMIHATAKRPSERLQSIRKIVQTENFSQDPMIRSLEFTIADKPMSLDGRILPPPSLMMNKEFVPYQGVWDARGKTFFRGAQLNHWVVMNYEPEFITKKVLQEFLCLLKKIGEERGMSFGKYPVIQECHMDNLERDFIYIKRTKPEPQMILVVLPRFGDIYARVKKTGDMQVKIVTQCVQSKNVDAAAIHTVGHLLLKINVKIGGTNNILTPLSELPVFPPNVMIMGADVNHPPAGDKVTPSLAAVVASADEYASKYFVEVRHQKHRREMIQEMKEMTKNLLKEFYFANNRTPPERIIMYRDGVSDSRFMEVLSFELKAMRDACTEIKKGYEPAITFLVVQKRHHTRLFCQETDGVGKSKNIPPGTTVDTDITHPTERDFFLCSHQGILGTSRPTHYHVLWDDSDLNMDQLQKLTYALCHLYSRCMRSVSIPAPAYHAHLAAFRAKVHIQHLCPSETSSEASGEEAAGPSDAVMSEACKIERENEIHAKLYYL